MGCSLWILGEEALVGNMANPLVSIGVKSCNNAAFIREALLSAFAQSYRPLEIVISDDGSSDGSWEVIRDVVDRYRSGKDDDIGLVLNRNERNLGNCGNWERICELAQGDWIFKWDGDDVSDAQRVARTMAAMARADLGLKVLVLSCGAHLIDDCGRVLGSRAAPSMESPVGAMMAFHRSCFSSFSRVKYPRVMDDVVWSNRARLLRGEEVAVDEPLVDYRLGSGVSGSFATSREIIRRCHATAGDEIAQARIDARKIGVYEEWKGWFDARESYVGHVDRLINGGTLGEKLRAIRYCARFHSFSGKAFLVLNLIPGAFGDWLIRSLSWIKRKVFARTVRTKGR